MAILLFTHLEFFQFIKDWYFLIALVGGALWGQYQLLMKRADVLAAEAKEAREKLKAETKKETDELCERLEKVEEVDKIAYPKFLDLLAEVKELRETVKNHHEMRMTGIVQDIASMRDKYEYRFADTEKAIANINRNFEKLEDKLDRNAAAVQADMKQLMTAIMELKNR